MKQGLTAKAVSPFSLPWQPCRRWRRYTFRRSCNLAPVARNSCAAMHAGGRISPGVSAPWTLGLTLPSSSAHHPMPQRSALAFPVKQPARRSRAPRSCRRAPHPRCRSRRGRRALAGFARTEARGGRSGNSVASSAPDPQKSLNHRPIVARLAIISTRSLPHSLGRVPSLAPFGPTASFVS